MRNKKTVWLLLTFFLVALIGTMGWVSHFLLDVDREERDANRKAALEQNSRLALWRMEARLNVLLSSLPVLPEWAKNESSPVVIAGFRFDRQSNTLEVQPADTDAPSLEAMDAILAHSPQFDDSFNVIPDEESERNHLEVLSRYKVFKTNQARLGWHKGNAVLVGETVSGQVIGWVLDWPKLEALLIDDCVPLIENPKLEPLALTSPRDPERDLISIPLRLNPGTEPTYYYERPNSPARLMLMVAWSCIFLPAAGLGLLLFAAFSLNERRDAFVSAVTHELRTPLTTFSMYTEMLEGGMVPEEKRKDYLATLRREAVRLSHLVENVLAYARIERGQKTGPMESMSVSDQLEHLKPQLKERCDRAEMELMMNVSGSAATVRMDPAGFERIMLNLVDNACKYGVPADKEQVCITVSETSQKVVVSVRDYGPGVDDSVRKKLFKAFSKSDREAAGKVPGVGLGLALCRQLAQKMNGSLELDEGVTDGAAFNLSLPR